MYSIVVSCGHLQLVVMATQTQLLDEIEHRDLSVTSRLLLIIKYH